MQGLCGGTTVSATMLLAHRAGISVFVTGGIGGVHRNYNESKQADKTSQLYRTNTSFLQRVSVFFVALDVSADLTELSRTPVAVIASGVKSILDIPKTLEYLVRHTSPYCTCNVRKLYIASVSVSISGDPRRVCGDFWRLSRVSFLLFASQWPQRSTSRR